MRSGVNEPYLVDEPYHSLLSLLLNRGVDEPYPNLPFIESVGAQNTLAARGCMAECVHPIEGKRNNGNQTTGENRHAIAAH
jgi:hypothetical protein